MLNFSIDKEAYDALKDDIKAEYKEGSDEGTYKLDVGLAAGVEIADNSGLKTALQKERLAKEKAAKELKAFDGLDVKEAKEAIAAKKKYLAFDADEATKALIQDTKDQMAKNHATEMLKVTDNSKAIESQLKNVLVDNAAVTALQKAGGNIGLLMPHVQKNCRMTRTDDKYIVEILGDDGMVRIGGSQGEAMTISQLVTEMKGQEDFAAAFAGTGSSGTETPTKGAKHKVRTSANTKIINKSDKSTVNNNLEKIASGDVKVTLDK